MTKTAYMDKLKAYLHSLPSEELEDILSDYDEHFEVGLSKGKTAEEISKELGDPYDISRNYVSINSIANIPIRNNNNKGLIITILLIAFNVIIVLGPYVSIVALLIAMYISGISFIFGGIALLFGNIFNITRVIPQPHILTSFGFGIGLSSLGILTIILGIYLSRLLIDLTKKYISWNMEVVNRGGF